MKLLTFSQYIQADSFPLRVTVMPASGCQIPSPMHEHEFSELAYLATGSITHQTIKGDEPLQPGAFFFMHPGMSHEYINPSDDCLLYNVIYNEHIPIPMLMTSHLSLINEVYPNRKKDFIGTIPTIYSVAKSHQQEIQRTLNLIKNETENCYAGHTLRIISLFMELIVLLSRECSLEYKTDSIWDLDRAVNFLQCHYSEKISLEGLARQLGMSSKTMLRRFKSNFGIGPAEYLLNIRLQEARHLLKTTNATLETIACECGFANACHLWKSLKRKMHLTPRQIRGF